MASNPNPSGAAGGLPFFNLARGAKGVALLLFLLPWVTVSCAGQDLVSMSGLDLATGSISVRNPLTGVAESPPGPGRGADMEVLAAALLIIASLALTFVLRRPLAALVAIVGSATAAILLCHTVFVRIRAEIDHAPRDGAAIGMNAQQSSDMLRVETEIGFWLTLAALAAAIVLNLMARSRAGP